MRLGGESKQAQPAKPAAPEPLFPVGASHVWLWFDEIIEGAKGDGMGPVTIGWQDIVAWQGLTGELVEPWECRLLVRLSSVRATVSQEGPSSHGAAHPNRAT